MQYFLTSQGSGLVSIILILGVIVFFYFFMIRPQKKQEKEQANMRNSLEIGDEVVTIGGIIGQVVRLKGETVTIATGKDRTTLRFLRSAIREVTVKINAPEADIPPVKEKASKETVEAAPLKDESDKSTAKDDKKED